MKLLKRIKRSEKRRVVRTLEGVYKLGEIYKNTGASVEKAGAGLIAFREAWVGVGISVLPKTARRDA